MSAEVTLRSRETILSTRVQRALLAEVKPQLSQEDLALFLTDMIPQIFEKTDSLTFSTLTKFQSDYESNLKKAQERFFLFKSSKEITSLQRKSEIMKKVIVVAQRVLEEERRERNPTCGQKAWRFVCMIPKGGSWFFGKTLFSVKKVWGCCAFSAKIAKNGVLLLPQSIAWLWSHRPSCFGKCCCRSKEKIAEKTMLNRSAILAEKREERKESKEEKQPLRDEKQRSFDGSFIAMAQALVHNDLTKDFGMSVALKWLFAIMGDTRVEKTSSRSFFHLANEEYSFIPQETQMQWQNNKIPAKKFEGTAVAKIAELFSAILMQSSSCDMDLCRFLIEKIIPPKMISYTIRADGSFVLQYNKAHETTFHIDEKSGWPCSVDATLNASSTIQGKVDFFSGAITFEKSAFSISKWGASAEIASIRLNGSNVTLDLRFSGFVSVAEGLLRMKLNNSPTLTQNQFRAIFTEAVWS